MASTSADYPMDQMNNPNATEASMISSAQLHSNYEDIFKNYSLNASISSDFTKQQNAPILQPFYNYTLPDPSQTWKYYQSNYGTFYPQVTNDFHSVESTEYGTNTGSPPENLFQSENDINSQLLQNVQPGIDVLSTESDTESIKDPRGNNSEEELNDAEKYESSISPYSLQNNQQTLDQMYDGISYISDKVDLVRSSEFTKIFSFSSQANNYFLHQSMNYFNPQFAGYFYEQQSRMIPGFQQSPMNQLPQQNYFGETQYQQHQRTMKPYESQINSSTSEESRQRKKKYVRFNGMSEDEVAKRVLPDCLCEYLNIVFIGISPGLTSAYRGHHYAGPANHFWKCLNASGLTPKPMTAEEDYKLLHYGIGFTYLVERACKGSYYLKKNELRRGAMLLIEKLQRFRPKIAVFIGKIIYEAFSGKKKFDYGKQPELVEGTNTYIWVMPSSKVSSGQCVDKSYFYKALKKFCDTLNGSASAVDEKEFIFPLEMFYKKRK